MTTYPRPNLRLVYPCALCGGERDQAHAMCPTCAALHRVVLLACDACHTLTPPLDLTPVDGSDLCPLCALGVDQ